MFLLTLKIFCSHVVCFPVPFFFFFHGLKPHLKTPSSFFRILLMLCLSFPIFSFFFFIHSGVILFVTLFDFPYLLMYRGLVNFLLHECCLLYTVLRDFWRDWISFGKVTIFPSRQISATSIITVRAYLQRKLRVGFFFFFLSFSVTFFLLLVHTYLVG